MTVRSSKGSIVGGALTEVVIEDTDAREDGEVVIVRAV